MLLKVPGERYDVYIALTFLKEERFWAKDRWPGEHEPGLLQSHDEETTLPVMAG